MRKKLYIILGILFTISISIFVFNSIYQNAVPKIIEEINNSSIGAILTAIITVLLLSQQSSSEEVKERNVRVFEEKTMRFNIFINKLWDIWEDRIVSLEEINELIKIVSKDIILYTKPETVDEILLHLIDIAKLANPDKTDNKNVKTTEIIQRNIFNIINELAMEIGLGGELNDGVRTKLNELEQLVLPFIIQKEKEEKIKKTKTEFKEKFLKNFIKNIDKADINLELCNIKYLDNFIICSIKNSVAEIQIGPLERDENQWLLLGVFVFFEYRNFHDYRATKKGPRKDWLNGYLDFKPTGLINFSDISAIEKWLNENSSDDDKPNELVKLLVNHIQTVKYGENNKTLNEVLVECENQF